MVQEHKPNPPEEDEEMKPRGTIFILIIYAIVMIGLWGYIYLLMIQRGITI